MSEDINLDEPEKQATDTLLRRTITDWQRMAPGSFEEFSVSEDIEEGLERYIGSRARTFTTKIDGKEDVSVALMFWAEGGRPEEPFSDKALNFSIAFEEPSDTKLTNEGTQRVVATTISMSERGLTIEEDTLDYPSDQPEAYTGSRSPTPEDIQRVQQILDNIELGLIQPGTGTGEHFLDAFSHPTDIWTSLASASV